MTPEERNLLTRFLADLNATKGVQKDPEAATTIDTAIRANPDAAYLLVQHAILADQALAAAQARISELETEVRRQVAQNPIQNPPTQNEGGGFLGGLFGRGDHREPPPPPARPGPWGGPQPYSVVPQTYPQQGGFFGGGAPARPGGMGSFLANAGATAAGVAGGAFLFQGLSNLFGGHQGAGGFLGGYGGPQEVVNNYYEGGPDQDGGGGGVGGGGYGGAFDPSFGGDRQSFADASPDQGFDDVSYDSDNGDPGGDDYS